MCTLATISNIMKSTSKKKSQTKTGKLSIRWVAVSGGFDPLHIGHVRMFKEARRLGDKLVVLLNNDNWLCAKKGYAFMPEDERREMILAFPFVDRVVITCHTENDPDTSVARDLKKLRPTIFANGGDRKKENTPEDTVCDELGIKKRYGIGRGGKIQSSSWMIKGACLVLKERGHI